MSASSLAEVFRDVIGHFATGVTIVTTSEGGEPYGTTVSALSSVSLEPPMLLVCLNQKSRTRAVIERTRAFGVNILGTAQGDLARLFATDRDDKFDGLDLEYGELGSPLLADALAHVECQVAEMASGGTHTVFFGEIVRAQRFEGAPLLYYRGQLGWSQPTA